MRDNLDLLFLKEEQVQKNVELVFLAFQSVLKDIEPILVQYGYGRTHAWALHFINRYPGLRVHQLIEILGTSKQSLNRTLHNLVDDALVRTLTDPEDLRAKNLYLTPKGAELANQIAEMHSTRYRDAFLKSDPEAVLGFRRVLERLLDKEKHNLIEKLETQE